jgi:hypothetical protein
MLGGRGVDGVAGSKMLFPSRIFQLYSPMLAPLILVVNRRIFLKRYILLNIILQTDWPKID